MATAAQSKIGDIKKKKKKGVRREWVCNRRIRTIGKVSPSPVLSIIPRMSPYNMPLRGMDRG